MDKWRLGLGLNRWKHCAIGVSCIIFFITTIWLISAISVHFFVLVGGHSVSQRAGLILFHAHELVVQHLALRLGVGDGHAVDASSRTLKSLCEQHILASDGSRWAESLERWCGDQCLRVIELATSKLDAEDVLHVASASVREVRYIDESVRRGLQSAEVTSVIAVLCSFVLEFVLAFVALAVFCKSAHPAPSGVLVATDTCVEKAECHGEATAVSRLLLDGVVVVAVDTEAPFKVVNRASSEALGKLVGHAMDGKSLLDCATGAEERDALCRFLRGDNHNEAPREDGSIHKEAKLSHTWSGLVPGCQQLARPFGDSSTAFHVPRLRTRFSCEIIAPSAECDRTQDCGNVASNVFPSTVGCAGSPRENEPPTWTWVEVFFLGVHRRDADCPPTEVFILAVARLATGVSGGSADDIGGMVAFGATDPTVYASGRSCSGPSSTEVDATSSCKEPLVVSFESFGSKTDFERVILPGSADASFQEGFGEELDLLPESAEAILQQTDKPPLRRSLQTCTGPATLRRSSLSTRGTYSQGLAPKLRSRSATHDRLTHPHDMVTGRHTAPAQAVTFLGEAKRGGQRGTAPRKETHDIFSDGDLNSSIHLNANGIFNSLTFANETTTPRSTVQSVDLSIAPVSTRPWPEKPGFKLASGCLSDSCLSDSRNCGESSWLGNDGDSQLAELPQGHAWGTEESIASSLVSRDLQQRLSQQSVGNSHVNQMLCNIVAVGREERWLLCFSEVVLNPRRVLGVGSFGIVLAGRLDGADVAVKVGRHRVKMGQSSSSILNELSVLRHVRHPNVVPFYGACVDPVRGEVALVIGRVNGISLEELFDCCSTSQGSGDAYDRRVQPPSAYVRDLILLDVCSALRYLHCRIPAVAHGDLKGSNIMVELYGPEDFVQAYLLDFGLSHVAEPGAKPLGGTLRYMAPEVARRLKPTRKAPNVTATVGSQMSSTACSALKPLNRLSNGDSDLKDGAQPGGPNPSQLACAADVFSFGRVVYLVGCGKPPFYQLSPPEIVEAASGHEGFQLLWPERTEASDRWCRQLCDRCLVFSPAQRPLMEDVHAAVEARVKLTNAQATRSGANGTARSPEDERAMAAAANKFSMTMRRLPARSAPSPPTWNWHSQTTAWQSALRVARKIVADLHPQVPPGPQDTDAGGCTAPTNGRPNEPVRNGSKARPPQGARRAPTNKEPVPKPKPAPRNIPRSPSDQQDSGKQRTLTMFNLPMVDSTSFSSA